MKHFCITLVMCVIELAGVEYPYYVETSDGGYAWSEPARLSAITSQQFYWHDFDCEVCQIDGNNFPVVVHNDLESIMQAFYPYVIDPGGPGNWNWDVLNIDGVGSHCTYAGTTWTMTPLMYPNVSFLEAGTYGVILISYKCRFEIDPPPPGWTDGNYLGGIMSIDGGQTWKPCRPMSGPLLQSAGGPIEVAHRLIGEDLWPYDTVYCYSTWTDADDGEIGYQYFEHGMVQSIEPWWPHGNHHRIETLQTGKNRVNTHRDTIAQVGDSRSILGPAGKNICVAADGATMVLMYGTPSDSFDPQQPFGCVRVAYSTDTGMTWTHYGPFSDTTPLRRIYPSVDGCENFHSEFNNLFFAWQEGTSDYLPNNAYVMFEENIPSNPTFSTPILIPNNVYPWMPCIGVNPDNNLHIMVTAWSYLLLGDNANYAWISTDGGWTWSDKFMVTPPVDASAISAGAGHFRWGTGGYAFFTYHDEYDPAIEEQTVKSTPKIHLEVQPTIVNRHLRVLFTGAGRNHVSLKCYDTSGRLIQMIYEGNCDTGSKILNLDVSEFANGVYIVVLESSSGKQKIKLVKLE